MKNYAEVKLAGYLMSVIPKDQTNNVKQCNFKHSSVHDMEDCVCGSLIQEKQGEWMCRLISNRA